VNLVQLAQKRSLVRVRPSSGYEFTCRGEGDPMSGSAGMTLLLQTPRPSPYLSPVRHVRNRENP
jgi:hypothetical protein